MVTFLTFASSVGRIYKWLAYRTVSSCFRWPIRAYHVHLSAIDAAGLMLYCSRMKTLITVAAVAILGIYAFLWLLAAPVTVLVIGAAIWVISLSASPRLQ